MTTESHDDGAELFESDKTIDAHADFTEVVQHAPWDALDNWESRWKSRRAAALDANDLRAYSEAVFHIHVIRCERSERRKTRREREREARDVTPADL